MSADGVPESTLRLRRFGSGQVRAGGESSAAPVTGAASRAEGPTTR